MRRTLKIKTRLLLTVGFVAAMLAASSGVALWRLSTVEQSVQRVVRGDTRLAGVMAQFVLHVGDLAQHERAYLANTVRSRPVESELQAWKGAYTSANQRLTELDAVADGRSIAQSLRTTLRAYDTEFTALRSRIDADGIAKVDASGADGSRMREAFDRLERQSSDQLVRYRGQMDAGRAEVEEDINRGYIGIGAVLVVGFLLAAAALRYFVYGPVAAEADALARVCDSVAVGDLTSRVPNPSDTELGSVARSLNSMLDSTVSLVQTRTERDQMQAAVMKLLDEVSGVAEGDLTVQAEVTADVTGAVADSVNFMIGQLRQIIGQVQAASRQVSTALGDLREVTDKLATGSEDQAAQAVEASVAIEEMAASIHYVSENASSSATVAEQARTNAEHGTRAVTRTIEGMKAVRDQVQETAKRIKRLGESSQEIGEIVELIGDIGDRTSILALNASIQAAMAGEAGRGFAIVADEVERLADRATEATKRAGILVKTTQTEAAEVMAAMEDTTREVINRSNIANEAGVALSEIQTVSNRLAELIQAISDAAQQQARGSEQVAKSMNEMSSVTRNTAASTKQTAAAINSLALLVDNLNATVSRFKLPAATGSDYTEYTSHGSQPRLVAAR
jgi:methyl-accepting chemotaxis protein